MERKADTIPNSIVTAISGDKIHKLEKEIESLRSIILTRGKEIESLQDEITKQHIELGGRAQESLEADTVIESLRLEIKELRLVRHNAIMQRDEWKRRAKLMIQWMNDSPLDSHGIDWCNEWFLREMPKCREWFEEE